MFEILLVHHRHWERAFFDVIPQRKLADTDSTTSIVESLATTPKVPAGSHLDAADDDDTEDNSDHSEDDEAVACTDSAEVQEDV